MIHVGDLHWDEKTGRKVPVDPRVSATPDTPVARIAAATGLPISEVRRALSEGRTEADLLELRR